MAAVDGLHDIKVSSGQWGYACQGHNLHLCTRTVAVGIVVKTAVGCVVDQVVVAVQCHGVSTGHKVGRRDGPCGSELGEDTRLAVQDIRATVADQAIANRIAVPSMALGPFKDKFSTLVNNVYVTLDWTVMLFFNSTFKIDGAIAAKSICEGYGMGKDKAKLVHEMVALRNSVGVTHKLAPDIALLHYGAGVEVTASRLKICTPRPSKKSYWTIPWITTKKTWRACYPSRLSISP